jgi:alpha-L-rhamnosidase
VTSASSSIETPYGRASSSWELAHGVLALRVEVPAGAVADVVSPAGEVTEVPAGAHTFTWPQTA